MTPQEKEEIDAMSHYALLRLIRFAPIGDSRLMGEKGEYILSRREQLRKENPEQAVADSKNLGWR